MTNPLDMKFTGERFVPGLGGAQIAGEHAHRYLVARQASTGMRVLDLGCGTGYGSQLLAGYATYLGVDISSESIAAASRAFASNNAAFQLDDVAALSLESGSFDVVVCFEVIEHVDDPGAVLAEAARVLAPTGILCLSTPDKAEYNAHRSAPNPYHPSELTKPELLELLNAHFANWRILGQRFCESSIVFDPEIPASQATMLLPPSGFGAQPKPMYWYAIASNGALPILQPSSMPVAEERDIGAELVVTANLLKECEEELEARATALADADAREVIARQQLLRYEEELAALHDDLGASPRGDSI